MKLSYVTKHGQHINASDDPKEAMFVTLEWTRIISQLRVQLVCKCIILFQSTMEITLYHLILPKIFFVCLNLNSYMDCVGLIWIMGDNAKFILIQYIRYFSI